MTKGRCQDSSQTPPSEDRTQSHDTQGSKCKRERGPGAEAGDPSYCGSGEMTRDQQEGPSSQ